jgi:hypothetical protein
MHTAHRVNPRLCNKCIVCLRHAKGVSVAMCLGLAYGLFVVVCLCYGNLLPPLCSPSMDTTTVSVYSPTVRDAIDLGLLVVRGFYCSHKIKRNLG